MPGMPLRSPTNEELAEMRERGNVTKREQAALCRDLSTGRFTLDQLVRYQRHEKRRATLALLRVERVLRAVPGWTPRRVQQLLVEVDVDPRARWRALGPRQREAIVGRVSEET